MPIDIDNYQHRHPLDRTHVHVIAESLNPNTCDLDERLNTTTMLSPDDAAWNGSTNTDPDCGDTQLECERRHKTATGHDSGCATDA